MDIEGTVAATVNEYRIVVNIGSEDGVKESHRYGVYAESDPIEDPESGEELGRIEHKIAEVKPDKIKKEFSEMVTDEMEGGYGSIVSRQLAPQPKALTNKPTFKKGDTNVEVGHKIKFIKDIDGED